MSDENINLFEALWKCLEELRLDLLEEIEENGKKGYQIPASLINSLSSFLFNSRS